MDDEILEYETSQIEHDISEDEDSDLMTDTDSNK